MLRDRREALCTMHQTRGIFATDAAVSSVGDRFTEMIGPAMDEFLASLQHLRRASDEASRSGECFGA